MTEHARAYPAPGVAETLLAGLFDDAAIFPPGDAPMPAAVEAHLRHRGASYAGLLGPFLCSAARLDELAAALADLPVGTAPLPVALVVAGSEAVGEAVEALAALSRAVLAGVEVAPSYGSAPAEAARLAVEALRAHVPPGVPVAVEVPRGEGLEAVLDVLAAPSGGRGVRAKLRTGGLVPEAFPTEQEVAAFLLGCARRGLTFKCTAGLHHAVRQTEASTGLEQHGYLNMILATRLAATGEGLAALAGVLAERDDRAVRRGVLALDGAGAEAVRELFSSFGTCSIDEPVDDAVALGLLREPPDLTR